MHLSEPTARGPQLSMSSDPINRRAWVRIGCDFEISGHESSRRSGSGWTAKVRNISGGGIGLLLRHCFQPGTPLMIDIKSRDESFSRTLSVNVVRATAVVDEGHTAWLLGCAFAQPLSLEELQRLV